MSGRDRQGLLNHPANAGLTSSAPDLKPYSHVLSARLSLLVSSKPSGVSTCSILTGSFHRAYFCISSLNSHAVRFNDIISFHTRGNYGTGLIAVNSTVCQWSHHRAVTQLPFGHTEIALNCTIISSHYQLSLQFCLSAQHIFSECLYVEILYEMSDC